MSSEDVIAAADDSNCHGGALKKVTAFIVVSNESHVKPMASVLP